MRQLSGLDNLMIQGELPNLPMHMSALMIYRTRNKAGASRLYESFQQHFSEVVDEHFPILRCRLENLPLQLDQAYWVEDPHFDPGYHISRFALPAPGDWAALYELFGQFHAQPLDQARPLWQVWCVEGLDQLEGIPRGSTALFLKIHHAVMDGKSAQRLMSSFHSTSPEPGSPLIAASMPREKSSDMDFTAPSLVSRYGKAWWHNIKRPVDLVATLAKVIPELIQTDDSEHAGSESPTPRVRFNHAVAPDRVIGHQAMNMKTLRRLEKRFACTINDISLCVIAGALRTYLASTDELPGEDLKTLMPIDVRRPGQDGSIGNQVTVARVSLHTAIADVEERLAAIHADTRRGKKRSSKHSAHALLHLADDIHPALVLWLGRWLVSSGHIDDLPQTVNTVVTNVPGVPHKTYIEGMALIDYLGFGPLAPNMGLFHTVSSTSDHVNISFHSTAEFIEDGASYRAALAASWDEVVACGITPPQA